MGSCPCTPVGVVDTAAVRRRAQIRSVLAVGPSVTDGLMNITFNLDDPVNYHPVAVLRGPNEVRDMIDTEVTP